MANTIVALAVDFTQASHASAFAQIITLATQAGIPVQVGVGASAPVAQADAPANAQAQAPKAYEDVHDVALRLVVDKAYVSYASLAGKYVGESGVRKALNARIREAGGVWDADRKAYKFASAKAANKFAETASNAAVDASEDAKRAMLEDADTHWVALVTAQEWQAQRDKAAARKAKKG